MPKWVRLTGADGHITTSEFVVSLQTDGAQVCDAPTGESPYRCRRAAVRTDE